MSSQEQAIMFYKMYKEFYKKEPNLAKDNMRLLTIEFQTMIFYIQEYYSSVGEYGFVRKTYRDFILPMSGNVQTIITKYLAGNERIDDSKYNLDENFVEVLNILGTEFRNVLSEESNPIDKFNRLSLISYFKSHVRPVFSDENVIRFINCSKKDLEDEKNIRNNIKKRLENNNCEYAKKRSYILKNIEK